MRAGLDPELEELERRCRDSAERSRARRASASMRRPLGYLKLPNWRIGAGTAVAVVAVPLLVHQPSLFRSEAHPAPVVKPVARVAVRVDEAGGGDGVPPRGALRDARTFARQAGGIVSFAVVDRRGRLRGKDVDRQFVSASVVKSMLLAAELRRLKRAEMPLDPATQSTLEAMITQSDNASADAIYYRVGDRGLNDIAARAGMTRFSVAGYWANAQVTAADMARLFAHLERLMAGPHRKFGLGVLGSIVPEQHWGIPAAAGDRWAVRFKGGWRQTELGSLVHQAAELRRDGALLSLAVLTDGQPSQVRGIEVVREVASRILTGGQREPTAHSPPVKLLVGMPSVGTSIFTEMVQNEPSTLDPRVGRPVAVERNASRPVWAPELARESPLLQEAFEFARWAHHGPRRQDRTDVSHPLAVAELLHEEEWPEEVVAAALLHDVIEDTSTELDEIGERFGSQVCGLVRQMTEDDSIGDYRERKAEHRSRAARNGDVAAIFAADKLANAREVDAPDSLPGEKLEHYLATVQVLCTTHPELPFLSDLQAELERLRQRRG